MALIYEDKIPNNKEAFIERVHEVADALGINANSLMLVMFRESGLKPWAQNTKYPFKDGYATGLIQFIPSTARSLGTSTTALKNMSNVDQLYYVYKYYEPYKNKLPSDSLLDEYTKLHLITFYPNADRKLGGTLTKEDEWRFPDVVYRNNPQINVSKDGILTIGDFKAWAMGHVPEEWKKEFSRKRFSLVSPLGIGAGLLVLLLILAAAGAFKKKKKS